MLVTKTAIIVFVTALQIFFEPEHTHWVAIAYIDGEIRLFDSSFNGQLSRSVEYEICRVYRDTATVGNILVTVVPVPRHPRTFAPGGFFVLGHFLPRRNYAWGAPVL